VIASATQRRPAASKALRQTGRQKHCAWPPVGCDPTKYTWHHGRQSSWAAPLGLNSTPQNRRRRLYPRSRS
jgi:hypothetical protein